MIALPLSVVPMKATTGTLFSFIEASDPAIANDPA
jgi:hypothetical protein